MKKNCWVLRMWKYRGDWIRLLLKKWWISWADQNQGGGRNARTRSAHDVRAGVEPRAHVHLQWPVQPSPLSCLRHQRLLRPRPRLLLRVAHFHPWLWSLLRLRAGRCNPRPLLLHRDSGPSSLFSLLLALQGSSPKGFSGFRFRGLFFST